MNLDVHKNDSLSIYPIGGYIPPTAKDTHSSYDHINETNSRIHFDAWVTKFNDPNLNAALSGKQFYLRMKEDSLPGSSIFSPLDELVANEDISSILNRAIQEDNIAVVQDLIEHYPEEFKAALIKEDILGLTPVFWVVIKAKKVFEYFSLMAGAAPEEFKNTVDKRDHRDYTYLSLLVQQHALKTVKFLANFAPVQFSKAVRLSNEDGHTPVALAVLEKDIKMLKVMVEHAREEFQYAMTKPNLNNETVVSLACEQSAILKYMHTISSEAFHLASITRNDWDMSILDLVKQSRPRNHKEISRLYKKDSAIKITQKEIFNRVALSHFFDVSGCTDVMVAKSDRFCATVDLEGWQSPQWFNLIEKDLDHFQQAYPFSLEISEMDRLREACRFEADHNSYTLQQRLEALKSKRGGFLSIGFFKHEITLVVRGNSLGVCNRGDGSRNALEFFQFNPKKLNFEVLKKMLGLKSGTKENYEKVFYDDILKELECVKTPLADKLEKNNYLFTNQEVGNCSLVSPITALYAYRLLMEVMKVEKSPLDMDNRMLNALDWYHTWLNFQRILVLARSIQPLESKEPYFKPDHELISECLARAYMLNMDEVSRKKLKSLANIYLKYVDLKQRIDLRVRLNECILSEKRVRL